MCDAGAGNAGKGLTEEGPAESGLAPVQGSFANPVVRPNSGQLPRQQCHRVPLFSVALIRQEISLYAKKVATGTKR